MQSIGSRIKQQRTELNLSQTDIEKATGISSGNLSEIENGKCLPSAPTLILLSTILNCSIDWILKGEDFNTKSIARSDEEDTLPSKDLTMQSIGSRIKNRRKTLQFTQTDIEKSTGISSGNLSGIENGKYLPSAIALLELSKILNCSVDWILTGHWSSESNISLITEELELLNNFRKLPTDEKEELMGLLKLKLHKLKKKTS